MNNKQISFPEFSLKWLVILRIAIGWHFLYEGIAKLLNPNWSSSSYLLDSQGIFASVFYSFTRSPDVLKITDFLNEWGLVLIGLGLILGGLTRIACYAGMLLLAFYYLSHPPFIGIKFAMPAEGEYLFINKIFIEFCALGVLSAFPTGKYIGLDRLFYKILKNKTAFDGRE